MVYSRSFLRNFKSSITYQDCGMKRGYVVHKTSCCVVKGCIKKISSAVQPACTYTGIDLKFLKNCSFTYLYRAFNICHTWPCEKLLLLITTTSWVSFMTWISFCFFRVLLLPPLSFVWLHVTCSALTGSGAEVRTEKGCLTLDSGASIFTY